jgi:hypothetical protein
MNAWEADTPDPFRANGGKSNATVGFVTIETVFIVRSVPRYYNRDKSVECSVEIEAVKRRLCVIFGVCNSVRLLQFLS